LQRKNESMFWLNDARLLAATAIIFVHFIQSVGGTLNASLGTLDWWEINFFSAFTMWGVPVFVMISGALLLSTEKEYATPSDFYSRRLSRLGIPILFWTLFYLALTFLKSQILGQSLDLEALGMDVIAGRPYGHMWYLYMVFGLYLFTPFLRKIAKYSSDSEMKLLVAMLMFISFLSVLTHDVKLHHSTIFIFMFPAYLAYFFAGHLIMRTSFSIKTINLLLLILLFGLLTALGSYASAKYGWRTSFHNNFSLTMIPLSISIMLLAKNMHDKFKMGESVRNSLATFTLGAYLIHPVLIGIIVQTRYLGFDMSSFTVLKILILTSLIILLSLIIAYVFSKLPLLRRVI